MRFKYRLASVFVLASIVGSARSARAVEQIVELRLQRVKCLCGVVMYPSGQPLENARVEELDQHWNRPPRRSTETDSAGRFKLASVKGQRVYYLQISVREPGVNLLRVPVQIKSFRGAKLLRLRVQLA